MKTTIILLMTLSLSGTVFAQSSSYSIGDNPETTLTNLKAATTISDISPLLWRFIALPAKDRYDLDYLRKQDSAQGFYIQPPTNNYPNITNVVFVSITTLSNGLKQTENSNSGILTPGQKRILETADMSSNIELRIQFTFKNFVEKKEGIIAVTVIPEQEARYKGGEFDTLSNYLQGYVDKRYITFPRLIDRASVLFTVMEDGRIDDIHIRQSSGNAKIDQLLIEALLQMPKWIPARNGNGVPVRQKINFSLSGGC